MQKTWITVGIFLFALCFLTGVVVSRTGLQWWVSIQQEGPMGSHQTPPPLEHSSSLQLGHMGAQPDTELEKGHEGKPQEFFHRDPQAGLGLSASIQPFSLEDARIEGDRYVVDLSKGQKAILTLSVHVQEEMEALYGRYGVPRGSFVAVDPKSGNVLALVGYANQDGDSVDGVHPALRADSPSASLFKTITAAALIEDQGLQPTDRVCWRGEISKTPTDEQVQGLQSNHGLECTSFARAYGRSNNPVFSHLAWKHLSRNQIASWAARLGFNERIPFDVRGLEPSTVELSKDPIEFGRNAAGFWGSTMSPFHATLISAAIANGGVMMRPNIIERIVDGQGRDVYVHKPIPYKRVMREDTAKSMMDLMVRTTTVGTARSYFHQMRGLPQEGFTVGGKTGTLSRNRPYRMYSWFSGIASAEDPRFAFSALVCNPMKWKIKGGYAASQGLQELVKAFAPEEKTPLVEDNQDAAHDGSVEPPNEGSESPSAKDNETGSTQPENSGTHPAQDSEKPAESDPNAL